MQLTFLTGHEGDRYVPLTKTFERADDGQLIKHSYPLVARFSTQHEQINSLPEFKKALERHAKKHHCLLKGYTDADLNQESRAGATDSDTPTEWICLDVDGIRDITKPGELLNQIPELKGVHYIVQYSASMGLDPDKGLSCHIFMLLTEPMKPSALKEWLKYLNLTIPMLRENLRLSPTGAALSWPLDITVCQNDKLIYIAPPICKNGLKDGFEGPRIQHIKQNRTRWLTLDTSHVRAEWNATESKRVLNELRNEAGLEKKNFSTKILQNVEVLAGKPAPMEVTSWCEARDFVYLNLDGGDSWGYFFPWNNPEILYNFKGEPNYVLKELAPEFYKQYKQQLDERLQAHKHEVAEHGAETGEGEARILAFRERQSDAYYLGHYDTRTGAVEFNRTDSMTKICHYFIEHHATPPEYIPTWDYQFRFDLPYTIDVENKFLNKYRPTPFMNLEPAKRLPKIPPTIERVLQSVFREDKDTIEHFLNWVACIYQYRSKTQAAWLIQGIEGTGKGVLFEHILAPLFGHDYCKSVSINQIEDQFNQFLEDTVLLFIDESDVKNTINAQKVMSRLRDYITAPQLTIRPMRAHTYRAPSFLNIMVATNKPTAVLLSESDRRFNVGAHQDRFLDMTRREVEEAIPAELEDFARHVASRQVDRRAARKPLETTTRDQLIQTTVSSIDAVASALLSGNLEFFFEALPTSNAVSTDDFAGIRTQAFKEVLAEMAQSARDDEALAMSRDQIHTLFRFCVDKVPETPKKFTHFLKHHRIFTKRIRRDGELTYGMHVRWEGPPEIIERILEPADKQKMRAVQ